MRLLTEPSAMVRGTVVPAGLLAQKERGCLIYSARTPARSRLITGARVAFTVRPRMHRAAAWSRPLLKPAQLLPAAAAIGDYGLGEAPYSLAETKL
jgi:hypothetical protein